MAEFNELIRNFDKIRDYMRDFYIYGFKSRGDFNHKSLRTYDNEKRRIESYMGKYMKWDYTKNGKTSFISIDCGAIPENPLYVSWKSKAFTNNDIMLHFYILDILKNHSELSVDELTDKISEQSEQIFDVQTVRIKCNEYVKNGLLLSEKKGRVLFYRQSRQSFMHLLTLAPNLMEAVKFFQGSAPFGEIGSFILDHESAVNHTFSFKHYYVAHTLEDGILMTLLSAIRNHRAATFVNYNERSNWTNMIDGIPLKIFISAGTGRRYLCVYKTKSRRLFNYRLDHIKSVKIGEACPEAVEYEKSLERNIDKVWGVSFGGRSRLEIVSMELYIHEKTEGYILERLTREGHGGKIQRIRENTFLYTKELYDTNDMSPWIKTFIGRIVQLEGTNQSVINRIYNDISRMANMYGVVKSFTINKMKPNY